jgi:hypothetical protein
MPCKVYKGSKESTLLNNIAIYIEKSIRIITMNKVQVVAIAAATFVLGLILGRFVPIGSTTPDAACDEQCQLEANIAKCGEILPKLDEYLTAQSGLVVTDYDNNRLVFRDFFTYIDSFYAQTYSKVNINQQAVRDAVGSAADRSGDLYKEFSTTNDPTVMNDLKFALDQNIKNINFFSDELKKSCAELKTE